MKEVAVLFGVVGVLRLSVSPSLCFVLVHPLSQDVHLSGQRRFGDFLRCREGGSFIDVRYAF